MTEQNQSEIKKIIDVHSEHLNKNISSKYMSLDPFAKIKRQAVQEAFDNLVQDLEKLDGGFSLENVLEGISERYAAFED